MGTREISSRRVRFLVPNPNRRRWPLYLSRRHRVERRDALRLPPRPGEVHQGSYASFLPCLTRLGSKCSDPLSRPQTAPSPSAAADQFLRARRAGGGQAAPMTTHILHLTLGSAGLIGPVAENKALRRRWSWQGRDGLAGARFGGFSEPSTRLATRPVPSVQLGSPRPQYPSSLLNIYALRSVLTRFATLGPLPFFPLRHTCYLRRARR
jgi:hypothetical protein